MTLPYNKRPKLIVKLESSLNSFSSKHVSANRSGEISIFNDFSHKNTSRYGSRSSDKFHQITVFNVIITKNFSCVGTVGA